MKNPYGATDPPYLRHDESSSLISASPEEVFDYLDDHTRLASHMSQSSWRMGGGRMGTSFDDGKGQRIGSHIRMKGRVLGLELFLDEVVTERVRPTRKSWQTVGVPRLLVVGPYRMGFDLTPGTNGSILRVVIDYALPPSGIARLLGRLFGGYYARWCTTMMVNDTLAHFRARQPVPQEQA